MSEKNDNIQRVLGAFLSDYGAKLHVRQIARMVEMNRQTTSVTLKKMESERLLDSEISGRNKLYFINRNSQRSKILVTNAENLKKIDICRKREIARLIDYVGSGTVVLFGSYAKGNERESSDIDLLVLGKNINFRNFEKETGREVQMFVMSEKQFIERLTNRDHLVVEAVRDHVCLRNTERFVELLWSGLHG